MAYITRQGIGTLVSVEQLNPDIPDSEYAWRREKIGISCTLFLLTDEVDSNLNMIYMHCGITYYRTGTGAIVIEPAPDGCEYITITKLSRKAPRFSHGDIRR